MSSPRHVIEHFLMPLIHHQNKTSIPSVSFFNFGDKDAEQEVIMDAKYDAAQKPDLSSRTFALGLITIASLYVFIMVI